MPMIRSALQLAWFSAAALAATVPATPVAIAREQVAAALLQHGSPVDATQIELLGAPVSRRANPPLAVTEIGTSWDGAMKARLVCRDSRDCLPFYVVVKTDDRRTFEASRTLATMKEPDPIVLRTGASATLVIQSGRVEITLPVICLENGAIGHIIRVTNRERSQIFKAQVVSDKLLKGGV